MPIFDILGHRREEREPEPKRETWGQLHDEELRRLLFAKYLRLTGRITDKLKGDADGC